MIPTPAAGGARLAYVYLLRSRQDGTWYVGWTTNPLRRLVEHNQGQSAFTCRKMPWRLVGFEPYATIDAAKARERALKRSTRSLTLFKKRLLNRATPGRPRQVWG